MKASSLIFAALICAPALGLAQDQSPVLADGLPPLTQDMATRYMHFMQWALRTPLTQAQEARITDYLVTSWKSNKQNDIKRTLNLLALRDQLAAMQLSDNPWAAFSTGQNALHYWNHDMSGQVAMWGLAMFKASHTPLVAGSPPLTKQMDDAYEEMGYFMLDASGTPSDKLDAVYRTQLADAIARDYSGLTAEQKANFSNLPKLWVQLRNAWPTLDDSTKSALKADWKAHFFPTPKPKAGVKAPVAAPVPAALRSQDTLAKLSQMKWILTPDSYGKISAVGTPYTNGW